VLWPYIDQWPYGRYERAYTLNQTSPIITTNLAIVHVKLGSYSYTAAIAATAVA
jgi:hypothetical protein